METEKIDFDSQTFKDLWDAPMVAQTRNVIEQVEGVVLHPRDYAMLDEDVGMMVRNGMADPVILSCYLVEVNGTRGLYDRCKRFLPFEVQSVLEPIFDKASNNPLEAADKDANEAELKKLVTELFTHENPWVLRYALFSLQVSFGNAQAWSSFTDSDEEEKRQIAEYLLFNYGYFCEKIGEYKVWRCHPGEMVDTFLKTVERTADLVSPDQNEHPCVKAAASIRRQINEEHREALKCAGEHHALKVAKPVNKSRYRL